MPPACRLGQIHLGTSAFTAAGWEGSFYPAGMKPADYLTYYATKFDTVEVDSTFYRTPAASTVSGWARKTPDHFIFAVKVPQLITHEKVLVDCDADFKQFVDTMDLLGEKLGPMLLQFPYFNRSVFTAGAQFLARLKPFLEKLPQGPQIRRRDPQQELARRRLRQPPPRSRRRAGAAGPELDAACRGPTNSTLSLRTVRTSDG